VNSNSVVVGPVLTREGGFAFDTWSREDRVSGGYVYRRIEDAYYARKALVRSRGEGHAGHIVVCDTVDEFARAAIFMAQPPATIAAAQRRLALQSDPLVETTPRLGSRRAA
jgi:hypothetical protein